MDRRAHFDLIAQRFGDLSVFERCPSFWLPKPAQGNVFIESLREAKVHNVGRTVAGREIVAIEYGEPEPIHAETDNLHSAIAAGVATPQPDPTAIFPAAFYGRTRRRRPVIAFQGAIHGGEHTGTVASLNLCQIIEKGTDLRGKPWARIQELARRSRILIIPWLNVDGVERWPFDNPETMTIEQSRAATNGIRADGSFHEYPAFKLMCPMPVESGGYLGSYFNDAGINLQYDFCAVERQPETAAWMRYYLKQRPDAVVVWHCNAGTLMGPPEYYLPPGHQHTLSRLAGAVHRRVAAAGFESRRLSWGDLPGMGKPFMEQTTAIYHTCGATPLMCELPMGGAGSGLTCDQLLDIGLLVIEETLEFAHDEGLRPYEFWSKVRRGLNS